MRAHASGGWAGVAVASSARAAWATGRAVLKVRSRIGAPLKTCTRARTIFCSRRVASAVPAELRDVLHTCILLTSVT